MKLKPTILIAEDEPDTLQYLLRGLISKRRHLYDTRVCIDGLETMEIMAQIPISCLILDLEMKNLNGLETLERMRTKGFLEQIPVIISSGYIDVSMKLQLASYGVKHILKKPYEFRDLLESIDDVLMETHENKEQISKTI